MAKVDFARNPDDLEAATLAAYGIYSRIIGNRVGMTAVRAQYRVWKSGGSEERRAWREARSETFVQVMRVVHADVQDATRQRIAALELERAANRAKREAGVKKHEVVKKSKRKK